MRFSHLPTCVFSTWHHDMGMELDANTIHLWQLDLTQLVDKNKQCQAVLNIEERVRAARYKVAAPRETFVLVRGTLRNVLADYIGLAPATVPLSVTSNGKPVLDAPYQHIHFNVSHTKGLALIAVANVELGVDVERITPLDDLSSIARRYFSDAEWQQLNCLKGEEQLAAFYRVWTRKEAYIKARGEGLGYPLRDFDVDGGVDMHRSHGDKSPCYNGIRPINEATDTRQSWIHPAESFVACGFIHRTHLQNLLLEDRHDPQATNQWHIQAVDVPLEYTAALAVQSLSALPVMRFTESNIL